LQKPLNHAIEGRVVKAEAIDQGRLQAPGLRRGEVVLISSLKGRPRALKPRSHGLKRSILLPRGRPCQGAGGLPSPLSSRFKHSRE
jgi:hypothetical protein